MEYQPKVVLCRLHMAGKTIQQIREECAGQGMTYRDFENIQRANEYFDGVRCRLSLWEWDNYESYHLDDWDAPDDERMMMAIYYSEQVHPVPRYKNDLEKFKADWEAGTYDPGGVICFNPRDVEVLEVVSEEVKPPAPPPAPSSPPPMSAERADNQEMSVDRAALQLKNLLEYCMGKGESFDHSRDWTADVHALYIAIDKLAD